VSRSPNGSPRETLGQSYGELVRLVDPSSARISSHTTLDTVLLGCWATRMHCCPTLSPHESQSAEHQGVQGAVSPCVRVAGRQELGHYLKSEFVVSGVKIKSTADHHCELFCIFFASAAIEALTAAFGESTGGIPSTTVYCAFCPSQNCQP